MTEHGLIRDKYIIIHSLINVQRSQDILKKTTGYLFTENSNSIGRHSIRRDVAGWKFRGLPTEQRSCLCDKGARARSD